MILAKIGVESLVLDEILAIFESRRISTSSSLPFSEFTVDKWRSMVFSSGMKKSWEK